MEALYVIFSWGSPVGIGMFFVLGAVAFYIISSGIHAISKQKK